MTTPDEMTPQSDIAPVTRYKPVAFALVSLAIIFFLYQIVGGGITVYLFGKMEPGEAALNFRLAMMLAEIIFILLPAVFLTKIQTKDWKSFLRVRKTDWYYIGLAIVGIIALQQLLEIYLYLQSLVPMPHQFKQIIDQLQNALEQTYKALVTANSPIELLFVVLVVCVTPAICEETLFRGLVQRNLELPMPKNKAIIITGIIFGAYHLDPFTFIALCALGIYLSFLASITGSIWVPIAAHFTNNFISTIILYKFGKESVLTPQNESLGVGYVVLWSIILFLIFFVTVRLTMKYKKSRTVLRTV